MKFCQTCGTALSIFNQEDTENCQACLDQIAISTKDAGPGQVENTLHQATLSAENGKLVLKSSQGWLLWSGSLTSSHSMHNIMERANRILSIRNKSRNGK